MGLQDMPFVVTAHLASFPHGFFARLGPRFLIRYYRTFLDGPLAVAVVSESHGTPTGYLVGILDTRQHRRLLLAHHGTSLVLAACLGMLARPWLAVEFAWTRLRRYSKAVFRDRQRGQAVAPRTDVGVLSHVVVSGSTRCRGTGTALVEEFVAHATAAGCSRCCLVTLAGTAGAGTFYERRGWSRTHQRRSSEGRELLYYALELR